MTTQQDRAKYFLEALEGLEKAHEQSAKQINHLKFGINRLLEEAGLLVKADDIRSKALGIARGEIGVKEVTGKNDGERIREYQENIDWLRNQAWCCSFVSWCFNQAAIRMNTVRPFAHEASVLNLYRLAEVRGWIVAGSDVKAGDLFLQMSADKTVGKHIGFVSGVSGSKFGTVEGNLSNAVGSISRNIKDYTFVRVDV